MILSGILGRFSRQGNNAAGAPIRLTGIQSLSIAQTEAPYLEMARAGRRMHGGTQILANGIAPVQAIPTTAATLALYNNDTNNNGLSLVVDWLNVFLGSGTSAAGLSVFAAIAKPTTAPTVNATGYGTSPMSGTSRGPKALWATGLTLPAGVNWSALVSTLNSASANVGQGDNFIDLGGRLIVPPGYALAIGLLAGAGTTPLFGVSAQWAEVELDLE